MISIGIDVSKGSSTVCAMKVGKNLVWKPFNIKHQRTEVDELICRIGSLNEHVRIVMEATGNYHLPLLISLKDAGFFVSVINPLKMKKFCRSLSFRGVKTDNSDASSIALYGLMYWGELEWQPFFGQIEIEH